MQAIRCSLHSSAVDFPARPRCPRSVASRPAKTSIKKPARLIPSGSGGLAFGCRPGVAVPGAVGTSIENAVTVDEGIMNYLKKLQQGSDVRGVAMDGIEGEPITLTPAAIFFISVGFGRWLSKRSGMPCSSMRVSVGRDPRISGPLLRTAIAAGLASEGANVSDFGLASTPAMFMSCILDGYKFDGGIMLTASHLPFNRNGMKFFTADGGLDKPDIKEILDLATMACAEAGIDPADPLHGSSYVFDKCLSLDPSSVSEVNFMPVYCEHLRSIIKKGIDSSSKYDTPLEGFGIAVDAGNGSGGFFATDVLAPLGADVQGSQFLDPDGTFPNHIPNPEEPEAAKAGAEAVLKSGADLGIIFDTDVDRSGVVDKTGFTINSNRMIALMSAITLREHPGSTIVTDSVTSNGLANFIKKSGGKHYRYRRGYKNVIGKGVELNENGVQTELMMETSGHGALKENLFLDDGAYMAVKIVIEMVKRRAEGKGGISDIIADLKEPLEAKEFRIRVEAKDFPPITKDTVERFRKYVESGAVENWQMEPENHEGWRVIVDEGDGQKGWCLLRPSIHDPLCVLNIESEVEGGLKATAKQLMDFFSKECSELPLNLSTLESVLAE
ncbi:hypothetical protein BSKO_03607 [Bryopsis sp. KO-2023]|nr:hypothetical protein BSKO_03607 [Bryopsis sp. KO-2023]